MSDISGPPKKVKKKKKGVFEQSLKNFLNQGQNPFFIAKVRLRAERESQAKFTSPRGGQPSQAAKDLLFDCVNYLLSFKAT